MRPRSVEASRPLRPFESLRVASSPAERRHAQGRRRQPLNRRWRRGDEALAELTETKRLWPDSALVHNEIGNVLNNSFGRMEEALAAYQQARTLDPAVPAVHHNIGLMLMRLGRFAEAIDPLNEALRLDPQYRNARYLLSDAYSRSGRYAEAVDSNGSRSTATGGSSSIPLRWRS